MIENIRRGWDLLLRRIIELCQERLWFSIALRFVIAISLILMFVIAVVFLYWQVF